VTGPPVRDAETRELLRRLESSRARRRRLRSAGLVLGGVVLIAIVAVAVALLTGIVGGPRAADGIIPADGGDSVSVAVGDGGATVTSDPTGTTDPTPTTAAPTTTPATTPTTAAPTTTIAPTTTTASTTSTTALRSSAAGAVVVIDPGHQAKADYDLEPVGPGSSEKKAKVSSGTASVVTGAPESQLVLAVSLRLRDALESQGIKVVMTRTTQDVSISNIERAQIANSAEADLFVRVHADGSTNADTAGIHVLYPASIKGWTDDIATASKKAASLAQKELVAATGAKDRGIDARSDITGFNWCDVPVILPEIGFMTNPAEDRLLATAAYQDKIVSGLVRAIVAFLGAG